MSRRHHTHTAAVSLFPFLDVLVCTMGSLILLLLVATNRIRTATVERAKQAAVQAEVEVEATNVVASPQPVAPEIPPESQELAAEWKTRLQQLTDERDALKNQLASSKSKWETVQSNVLRNKVKVASTADQLKTIRDQQEQLDATRQSLQNEIDTLQSDLSAAEERLAKAAKRPQTASSKFSILPFDGRSGTTKRPIFIECVQDRIRFVPEDVSLSLKDLDGFTIPFNPVLNATRELVHFWTAFEQVYGTTASPQDVYVLLLVRPDGIRSFEGAKRLLADLKVPHGYELLDEKMELEFAAPNAEAKKVCEQAISRAFAERAVVATALRGQKIWHDSELAGSAINGQGGSNERLPSGRSGSSGPLSANLARQRAFDTGRGVKSLDPDSEFGAIGQANPELPERSFPRGSGAIASRSGEGHGSGSEEISDKLANGFDTATGTQPANRSNARFSGSRTGDEGETSSVMPQDEPLPGSSFPKRPNDDSRPFPFSTVRNTATANRNGVATLQQEPIGNSQAAQNLDEVDPSSDPNAAKTRSRLPSSRSGSPIQASGDAESFNGSVGTSFDGKKKRSNSDAELRKRMRKLSLVRPGIGLEKAIPIRVWANRIVIGGEYEIPVDRQSRSDGLADLVLRAVDQVQSGWPEASKGYHWVPTLKYEVIPGGEQLQQRLNASLFDLGMTSKVEYLASDPEAAPRRVSASPSANNSQSGGVR